MIRMSKLADYAFILLGQMMADDKSSWSASDLAERTTLPLPTAAKLMKTLAKGGIVVARRGAAGGYLLARPASEISVADIVTAVDGPIALTECVDESEDRHCAVQRLCPLHGGWDKVNKAIKVALESVSLAEMNAGAMVRKEEERQAVSV